MKTKTFIIISTVFLVTLAACAQSKNQSDLLTNRDYQVEVFNTIDAEIVGNVIFTQDKKTAVHAEGKENEIENLIVKTEKGVLKLKMKNKRSQKLNGKKNNLLKVYVYAPEIVKVDHDGVGNFLLKGKVTADNLYLKFEGVGNLSAEQLECRSLQLKYEGVGNTNLKGSASFAEIKAEGVGSIKAEDFSVRDLIVRAEGVGSVSCNATNTIELYSDGVGGITYYGNPTVKTINKSGVGKIKAGR